MTKKELVKQMDQFFASKGFVCKGRHYYKEVSDEVVIVFGTQASSYGGYCYLEYGYCFKSISKYLPYPRFNQLSLNCGRIMSCNGQAIVYADVDETIMEDLKKTINSIFDNMKNLVALGRDGLIKHYLLGAHEDPSWYILGEETANYFGLSTDVFQRHFVREG